MESMNQKIAIYRSPFVHPFGEIVIDLVRRFGSYAVVLDVGGGGNRSLNLQWYINLDIEKSCKPTVVGDAHYLPFRTTPLMLLSAKQSSNISANRG